MPANSNNPTGVRGDDRNRTGARDRSSILTKVLQMNVFWLIVAVVAALAAVLAVAQSARADNSSVMVFNVANRPPNMTAAYLAKTERAIQQQVLMQVRQEWDVPQVVFGRDGVDVQFMPRLDVEEGCGQPAFGCHGEASDGSLDILVAAGGRDQEVHTLDHEILETLADPDVSNAPAFLGSGPPGEEICDPVGDAGYWLGGVWLSRFVSPSYFARGAA